MPLPLTVTAALLLIAPSLTWADSSVYSWRDADGTMTFTDNPALAPEGVKVDVRTYVSSREDFPRAVTQREFARRLAIELGLGDRFTAKQAADALAAVGIAPQLGTWELDEPMTPSLMARLRTLTVGAAVAGKIVLDPDQALFAFDSTAALVGIKIRDTDTTAPEPETAIAPTPVYVAPTAVPVGERVIYVGGGIVDPFSAGALPTIVVDQRIINIDNRIIVRKRAKPKHRAQRTVHRAKVPPPAQKSPYVVRFQRPRVGMHSRQRRDGEVPRAVAGHKFMAPRPGAAQGTVMSSRRVVTYRGTPHLRPNPRHAGIPLTGGSHRAR